MTPGVLRASRPEPISVWRIMSRVMLALIPGTIASIAFLGSGVLLNLLFAMGFAALLESGVARLRRRQPMTLLSDGSALLAAWLLALCLPPLLPFWQVGVGVAAMILLGKHLYGGLGNNPFNPAMVGYAVLIVSFPLTMTLWAGPGASRDLSLAETFSTKSLVSGAASDDAPRLWDAISSATPLTQWRTESLTPATRESAGDSAVESPAQEKMRGLPSEVQLFSTMWPVISLAWLLGGLYLLWKRIITWHIPLPFLLVLGSLHGLHALFSQSPQMSAATALFSGGAILGAFFIATDPVSAAASRMGRIFYATGLAVLTFVIREFSAYPEGIAFAVLLMNCVVPIIDHFSGTGRGSSSQSGSASP